MMVEKAAVRRAERSGTECLLIKPRTQKGGRGEDRLSVLSCKHGRTGSRFFQVPVCRIHQGETKVVVWEGAQNSVKGSPFWDHRQRVSVHARREALTLRSPCAHPAREVEVLKRHCVGEGESEVGANFTSFYKPSCARQHFLISFSKHNITD
jgi:hypothetical protein